MIPKTERELARLLDQTNLDPAVTTAEMSAFLFQVREQGFASAAIMPRWVPLAAEILAGSGIAVDSSVGFPMGVTPTCVKTAEAAWSIEHSPDAAEIDMVMNISLLKSKRYTEAETDIRAVVDAAGGKIVKVIIEVPLLTRQEIIDASKLVEQGGADFVKTSTGYKAFPGWRPTTAADITLIRSAVGKRMKIKSAGGMTSYEAVLAVLNASADRIGTSFGMKILAGFRRLKGGFA